jgi:hypothetical protein
MRGLLLILAAAAAVSAVPASAFPPSGVQSAWSSDQARGPFVHVHRGHRDGGRDGWERSRRHRERGGDVFLPYREYQGDTLWRADGFNDWWHDRPDRAFPRWVANNRDCERQFWAGGGWRC